MSISACDAKVSMLLSFLLANIKILSCPFFLFHVIFSNCFTIPIVRKKSKALAIPTGVPTTLINKKTDTPPGLVLKTIKDWSL